MDYKQIYKISKIYDVIQKDKLSNMISHAYLVCYKDSYLLSRLSSYICLHILDNLDNHALENKIINNNHADIKTYPTKEKTIKVKDIEDICDESLVIPLESDKKIFVLNDFDKATLPAQNKLLKTLEEPTQSVIFVIFATSLYNILPTIKSRCKVVNISEFNEQELVKVLSAQYKDANLHDKIARSFGNFLELENLLKKDTNKVHELCLDALVNMQNSAQVVKYSYNLSTITNKEDIFDEFIYIFRDMMVSKSNNMLLCKEDEQTIKSVAARYTSKAIDTLSHTAIKCKQKLKSNCAPSACIEDLLMKILEVKTR